MTRFEHTRGLLHRTLLASALAGAALGLAGAAQAQDSSMEERLRAQLRLVTGQLQQTQNELAQMKAGGAASAPGAATRAAAPDTEALRAELAQSRAQLAREREARARQDSERTAAQQQAREAVDKAGAQVAQFRGAYDELLKMARASEAERQRLGQEVALQKAAVAQCEVKNQQLYAVGMDVVNAYEKLDLNTVLSSRQPFATSRRVKLEEIAQQYGDKLYQSRFDVRAVNAPAEQAATTP